MGKGGKQHLESKYTGDDANFADLKESDSVDLQTQIIQYNVACVKQQNVSASSQMLHNQQMPDLRHYSHNHIAGG